MGRAVVYTGSRLYGRGHRRKTVRESWYVGANAFKFVTIAAVAVLLAMYVTTNAKNAESKAFVRQLSHNQTELQTELDALSVESARKGNAENLNKQAQESGLVKSTTETQIAQPK